ncbi:putative GOT1-membrane protein required for ER to Golgi transport [Leucosporidium creatinivorum]|uniref:Putative GOT1-membrane protein required for ER to Golgi transport n=1 Tax=Leucosporidium creatinivorum TaxID=106004 RepID=A0A1Y2CFP4_9BASI|nr:putative GOT1-membrane protein required for ER to Golgi transport [Leucosporidium creatinivorum]
MWLTDAQKIGVGLTSFGAFFMMLGVIMLFDGALLALGNILFVAGLPLIIGPRKTFYFFARRNKLRGTFCFVTGIVLVFVKYPFIGMIVETFGFLNLFGDFFPVVVSFLRQVPVIGTFLSLPVVRQVTDRIAGVRQSPV